MFHPSGRVRLVLPSLLVASLPSPALPSDAAAACGARLEGAFVESAPRDRFEFAHRSADGWTVDTLALDLAGSVGRLVFDTEDGGDGVEVFQPYRAEEGAVRARTTEPPADGGTALALAFGDAGADGEPRGADDASGFPPGARFAFSIDVDDRLDDSELGQIRVSGGEIEGARLSVGLVHADGAVERLAGEFGADARVELVGTPCPG